MISSVEGAKKMLMASGLFFEAEDFEEDPETWDKFILNMNDAWAWASPDCEEVKEDELPELARLFSTYGWCGVLYFVSQRNDDMRSEFLDNNRFIDFVKHEEVLLKAEPNSSKRAYAKVSYSLGDE